MCVFVLLNIFLSQCYTFGIKCSESDLYIIIRYKCTQYIFGIFSKSDSENIRLWYKLSTMYSIKTLSAGKIYTCQRLSTTNTK